MKVEAGSCNWVCYKKVLASIQSTGVGVLVIYNTNINMIKHKAGLLRAMGTACLFQTLTKLPVNWLNTRMDRFVAEPTYGHGPTATCLIVGWFT